MKSVKQYSLGGCSVAIADGTDLWGTPFRWPQTQNSGNMKVITSTVWEVVVLLLLIRGSSSQYAVEVASVGMIYIHTKSHDDRFWHLSNIKDVTLTVWEAITLLLRLEGTYRVSHYIISNSVIYIPSFMKLGAGFREILWSCLSNLNICNVGITDWEDLRSAGLRCAELSWYTYQVSWRLVKVLKEY
jgi:hypothetical protein